MISRLMCAAVAVLFLAGSPSSGQAPAEDGSVNGNKPHKPFRVIGNIYWVGLTDHGSYLLTTPKGHILIDTTSAETAPWVRQNIEKLGFKVKDIKIILTTHPHAEHVGGFAMFKELTGAKVMVPALDAAVLADGGRSDFREDGSEKFKPVKPDRSVGDGEKVELGGMTLVAHMTPGHTKGCTAWTTVVEDSGHKYNVVIVCPAAVAGDRAPLVNNAKYPNIAEDFAKAFSVFRILPCDVFLGMRTAVFKMDEKEKRLEQGEKPNPFIDPKGYQEYIVEYERRYLDQLAKDQGVLATRDP
jgi:metallo-beta-lactamase class B